jgi:hypothetical protein
MINYIFELERIIEDTISTVFKFFLFYRLITWYVFLFGIPFFFISFMCYRIIIYKIFNLISLSPLDKFYLSNNNRNNIIGVIKISNFSFEKIEKLIIEKVILKIKKMRFKLKYKFFNYYWEEIILNEALMTIEKFELEKDNTNKYLNNQISLYINVFKKLPYEIKIIKYKNVNEGIIIFKFDHIITDAFNIISLIFTLDNNYSYEMFNNEEKNDEERVIEKLLNWIYFPFFSIYCIYLIFLNYKKKLFIKNINKDNNHYYNIFFGEEHSLIALNKAKKKLNLSNNQLLNRIISNAFYNIIFKNNKEKKLSSIYIKCLFFFFQKNFPIKNSDIKLINSFYFNFHNLYLKDNISLNKQLNNIIKNDIIQKKISSSNINWIILIGEFLSYRVLNFIKKLIYKQGEIIIQNFFGPNRKIIFEDYVIENIYIFENSKNGIPFINFVSYNNKFQINLTIDHSLNIKGKDIINELDNIINLFIKSNE